MTNNQGSQAARVRRAGNGWVRISLPSGVAGALLAMAAMDLAAVEFSGASYTGNVDTTLTYGARSRVEERDDSIVGIPNGGQAFSVNGDDGNLNFDEGIASNAAKITSEMELDFDDWGAFLRGTAFYDYEIVDQDRERTPLSDEAEELVGRDAEILDAYLWKQFSAGENAGEVRLGNQVLSWGESTFIQNSINTINPIDVSKIRVPGAELREALEPIPLLSVSLDVSDNSTFDVFYQLAWQETVIDPPGSYFSTNDFAGEGGERVQLGFGGVPEGDFLGVPRGDDEEARDEGQFGIAYRLFVPDWNDTEFGFYYIRYHSRLPLISGVTGTPAGLAAAGQVYADAGVNPGDNALVDTLATDAYARTARYFIEYPEEIDLLGISFNTQLGTSGVALQGELSHRLDVPLQVDDVELLFAALSPFNPAFDASQINQFFEEDYGPGQEIPGFIRRDVTQIQFTGTRVFSQVLGADQLAVVAEIGLTHVNDFPDKDELRLESPGTYLSGNGTIGNTSAHGPGEGQIEPASAFADEDSWGYRLLTRLRYSNAIGSVNLSPRLAWSEDVNGNSPGPGGNFIEGRQALTLGVEADYQNSVSGDLSYTRYDGAGRYNLINDRDFVAFNLKFSF